MLESDRIEANKVAVQAFVRKQRQGGREPEEEEMLTLLERVLRIFSVEDQQEVETYAKEVMTDLDTLGMGNTKTAKRLANLLAILQEASGRIQRILTKMAASKRARLPADFRLLSGYSQLKSQHLVLIGQKRMQLDQAKADINSMTDYHKASLFSELQMKIEEVKAQIELNEICRTKALEFWNTRHINDYKTPPLDPDTRFPNLKSDWKNMHELIKAYEEVSSS